jgi:hypothetical protein
MTVKERKADTLEILMIDFNPVVREGLQAILTKDKGIEVVGDVPDGHEALLHIKQASNRGKPVHVVLTETRNGVVDGVQATKLIEVGWKKRTPKSDKIERRRCRIEKRSAREILEGIEGRSGKDGNGGRAIVTGSSQKAVVTAIDAEELDKAI